MIHILPSILEPTRKDFLKRYTIIRRHVRAAQLDVLNGTFVRYRDFHDPRYIQRLKPKLKLEVHLMIANVVAHLPQWRWRWVDKIIFHWEAERDAGVVIKKIRSMAKQPGLAINPETPVRAVLPLLTSLHTILVMSVHPGRNAQTFIPATLRKIRAIRARSRKVRIEVDGGINPTTAAACAGAGANSLVVGSYLDNTSFGQRLRIVAKSVS